MSKTLQTTRLFYIFCILCLSVLGSSDVYAQKSDSIINSIRLKRISKTPQIKASVPTYRPNYGIGSNPYADVSTTGITKSMPQPASKLLTVLKVYPNPVEDQINLILRLDRESPLSVKIMDLLGNEIVTLSNERTQSGEQTKNYNIPNRLNAGIYFLKISAGSETVVKRISVL